MVDADRFLADLDALREIGRVGSGVVRPAFSKADRDARLWLADRFRAAGLRPVFDPLGSLFGLPKDGDGPWLLVGSHSDSQPTGGWLDGALGVIAGLEAARVAGEAGGPPVAVVSFQDEEGRFGGLIGSRYFCGELSLDEALARRDSTGVRLADARTDWPELADTAPVSPALFTGYVEAHIEQGAELDSRGERAAVVEAITGSRQWDVRFIGEQNHAGTTRMARRRDAMRGLARLYLRLDDALGKIADDATVWTVGRVDLTPNAHSIVPGAASFTVQWRDCDADRLDRMQDAVGGEIAHVAKETGLEFETEERVRIEPARMDPALVALAEQAAEAVVPGAWRRLPSGAIHDAGPVSRVMPAVMVFSPSIGGVSHSFAEDTRREDLAACAEIVARTASGRGA